MDKPGTRFSVQNEDELWPGADPSHVSKRADGTIKDRPGERMFSAHQKQRNNDHTEG
ncbi:small, acid-soluble spore protein K [Sporolactobacillus laevolacticus]|uniref:small, acid-soluble spore protein K n=1 Tax=Sporolactobacillus laevolacticus TaxID=33018 RepID=UPI001F17C1DC|nr:small, acid-soluble spore protein K [Sporolactobacillus laevolacticus]MDN3956935.1 small, acid-soluble spore protein K [Sporolactobacillus laevolacticus]